MQETPAFNVTTVLSDPVTSGGFLVYISNRSPATCLLWPSLADWPAPFSSLLADLKRISSGRFSQQISCSFISFSSFFLFSFSLLLLRDSSRVRTLAILEESGKILPAGTYKWVVRQTEKVLLLSSTLRGCTEFIKGLFNVLLFMALLQLITVVP